MNGSKLANRVITLLPVFLMVIFVLSMVWPRGLSPAAKAWVFIVLAAAMTATGVLADIRRERRVDEMEITANRFGSQWGVIAGMFVMVVLIFLPSFQSVLVAVANWMDQPGNGAVPTAVGMFGLGFTLTVVLQTTAKALVTAAWKFSKR